jgi:prephenate dehydrogenase
VWVLTPVADTDPDAHSLVRSVVSSMGADVVELPLERHDALVAVVSHVPHLTAATLMGLAADRAEEHGALRRLAAGGFRDMTRIAAGHPGIWPDICAENRAAIVEVLDRLLDELRSVRDVVDAGDRERLAAAFDALSERSRQLRFLAPKPRLSSAELTYFTDVDHRTHEALVAVEPASDRIVGVARYATPAGARDTAEVALVVADEWQGRGIGTRLMNDLRERAIENGLARLVATTLHDNRAARVVLRRAGFRTRHMAGGMLELALELTPAG